MAQNQKVIDVVSALGGLGNIATATNCMTRLRVTVADESAVDEAVLRQQPEVLGLVHDREAYYEIVVGPGKAKTYADAVKSMMKKAAFQGDAASAGIAGKERPAGTDTGAGAPADRKLTMGARFKRFCKILGGIFVPLIPGFIVSGICGSFAMIIQQLVPGYSDDAVWGCLYNVLFLIQQSLLTYLTAWTGYRAAEQFGATPVLGGMLGMITSMSNINDIATFLGLYNADSPLSSVLMAGKGGVLAVVVGVFLLAQVERLVNRRMPDVLKVIGTPLVTMLICTVVYVFGVMPVAGFVASWLCDGMEALCMSDNMFVRIIVGYVGAALFLPLVALGMHHGLVALYAIQLQQVGYVTLYPALCMAGAGQVGAALAIRHKAKKCGNKKVVDVANAGIPAGFLGVGEPLVYGLTLPMGKPFITAGIGAGFGGAFVMFMQVAATTWGPSGLLGLCVMDDGPNGVAASLGAYAIGLAISYVMGFIITNAVVKVQEVAELYKDGQSSGEEAPAEAAAAAAPGEIAAAASVAFDSSDAASAGTANAVQAEGGAAEPSAGTVVAAQAVTEAAAPSDSASSPSISHGQPIPLSGEILFAPVDGRLIVQESIDDEVFRDGVLGDCFGIEPSEDIVYAPCDGAMALMMDSRHAFVIETSQGRKVMVHVGLGTVSMEGAGFEPLVSMGDAVTAGQPLLRFNRSLIRSSGYQDIVITAVMKKD